MDPYTRLERIWREISEVEAEKRESEHTLGLFFEHVPAYDAKAIERVFREVRDQILALKERKQALLQEQQELIVVAVTLTAETLAPIPAGAV